jgi:hypothetical protein
MTGTRALTAVGLVVTVAAAVGLTAMGLHYDATGGGPSAALLWVLWGGLLAGVSLLGAAVVRGTRSRSR